MLLFGSVARSGHTPGTVGKCPPPPPSLPAPALAAAMAWKSPHRASAKRPVTVNANRRHSATKFQIPSSGLPVPLEREQRAIHTRSELDTASQTRPPKPPPPDSPISFFFSFRPRLPQNRAGPGRAHHGLTRPPARNQAKVCRRRAQYPHLFHFFFRPEVPCLALSWAARRHGARRGRIELLVATCIPNRISRIPT